MGAIWANAIVKVNSHIFSFGLKFIDNTRPYCSLKEWAMYKHPPTAFEFG